VYIQWPSGSDNGHKMKDDTSLVCLVQMS